MACPTCLAMPTNLPRASRESGGMLADSHDDVPVGTRMRNEMIGLMSGVTPVRTLIGICKVV